jgi:glycosidase
MARRVLSVLLSLFLFAPQAGAVSAVSQLRTLAGSAPAGLVYDGATPRYGALSASASIREAKDLLAYGSSSLDGGEVWPFHFKFKDGGEAVAQGSGLEGFVYAEREIARTKGAGQLVHHVQDYVRYLDTVLASVSWAEDARDYIRQIDASISDPGEKYDAIMNFVRDYTAQLKESVRKADRAAWARSARIYEFFPRAYNLEGKRNARGSWDAQSKKDFFRDFRDQDLLDIKKRGFDTLWVMGIFPIGKRDPFGTAGGSPYSVSDHEGIHKDLGSPESFRDFVARAHRLGLRVIIDFIPNHTSMDSKMLNERPDFFVHRPAGQGERPYGYFEHTDPNTGRKLWVRHGGYDSYGSRAYWEDTTQVDYSNPALRRHMIGVVSRWVERFGVDGFRVDMAYQVTNAYFNRNWDGEMGGPPPRREFLEELITEVKARYPGTAFIAEGYDRFDDLSKAGFDLIYSKNNIGRRGGHHGWYDAMTSKDPGWIREAIRRQAYLDWQDGGMSQTTFIGNHDEPAPARALGPWMAGATFLTLLMPGSLLFYGSQEIGFDAAVPHEHKSIPFSVPVNVDWENADPEITRFHNETFRYASAAHASLGETETIPLPLDGWPRWTGYLLKSKSPRSGGLRALAVLANPSDHAVEYSFEDPELGIRRSGTLDAYGYTAVPIR